MAAPSSQPNWRFGAYELDRRSGELRRSGVRIRIQEQPFRILSALLERPGDLVTREELREILWPDDTFVDFEHSLNAAVNKLRETLGDSASHPRFVETVPRRGYRFIYPVEAPAGSGADPSTDAGSGLPSATVPDHSRSAARPRSGWWGLVWVSLLLVLLGVAVGARFFYPSTVPRMAATPVPLTNYPGRETYPSLSLDGTQVAFVRTDENQQNDGIWVKTVGPGPPYRLTRNPEDSFPAWSPDGKYIAFGRYWPEEHKWTIHLIPPLGGPELTLAEAPSISQIAWSPDATSLLISRPGSGPIIDQGVMHELSIQTREWKQLVPPAPQEWFWDDCPAVSPDGATLAFCRNSASRAAILIVPIAGGKPKQLASIDGNVYGLAWAPDGRDIIFGFTAYYGTGLRLLRLPVSGGPTQPLWGVGERGWYPAISPQKARLVYSRSIDEWNIWGYPLGNSKAAPKNLVLSSQKETQPQLSPDGKRILFLSSRSGRDQLWRSDVDGSNEVQLPSVHMPGSAKWSPTGEYIAFDDADMGNWDVFVMSAEGGSPRQLTFDSGMDSRPNWSRDGRWIYFNSERSGEDQIWRVPFQGGEAQQITYHGGFHPVVSPDGRFVYYGKDSEVSGIWRVPANGGEETVVYPALKNPGYGWWDVTDEGIYFIPAEADPPAQIHWSLQYFSFATGKVTHVTDLPKPPAMCEAFDVSSDGTWFLYAQWDVSGSDLMLVEDFR